MRFKGGALKVRSDALDNYYSLWLARHLPILIRTNQFRSAAPTIYYAWRVLRVAPKLERQFEAIRNYIQVHFLQRFVRVAR